ncbi:MAG TPA: TrgA family protein, partial [Sulfitobacter sp.]|nr:TrgA family protein [Sulfitobacter sp.]
MPTGARLMAAISLAVLAFILSGMVVPLMPESTDFGYFLPLNMMLGLLVGWRV